MALITLSRVLALAALLASAPLLARPAAAQRSAGQVRAAVFVTGQVQVFDLRPDTARIRPTQDTQRLAIAGVGALEVQTSSGAVTRFAAREANVVSVTIDFVAN